MDDREESVERSDERAGRWQRPRDEAAVVVRRGKERTREMQKERGDAHVQRTKEEGAQSRGACLVVGNDVVEETMSVTVQLAKEVDESYDIDLPTSACQSRTPSERRLLTRCEVPPVQGGGDDTNEHVITLHTDFRGGRT